jgi:hypothetical protein
MKKSPKKSSELGGEKKKMNEISKPSSSTGKTTKQIMRRHMKDKNDVITDEEFRNLNISPDISNDPEYKPLQIDDDKERPKDEDKDPAIIVPWDLISK